MEIYTYDDLILLIVFNCFGYWSLVFVLISNLTNGLRLHQFLGTCLPQ